MDFVEIVQTVEEIEDKVATLSHTKLGLLEALLHEGVDIEFDVVNHLDYLVSFIESCTDDNAATITETVDCEKVLNIILESARKNTIDQHAFLTEVNLGVGDLDLVESVETNETVRLPLLSVVASTLTNMLGEETVEQLPAEMIFDVVASAKELYSDDVSEDMNIEALVEHIASLLSTAIHDNVIDLDTNDYSGDTLEEFLEPFGSLNEMIEELQAFDSSEDYDDTDSKLMAKAKDSTLMIEAKKVNCPAGDLDCMKKKAKLAKEYWKKNKMHGMTGNMKDVDPTSGRLGKHVKAATNAFRRTHKKRMSRVYIQYVLVPAIIQRMRSKGKRMGAGSKILKR